MVEKSNHSENLKASYYVDVVKVLDAIELIWHLCEILFVDVVPGNCIFNSL